MAEAKEILSLDWRQLFLSLCIILFLTKALGTAIDWIVDKLGLETAISLRRKNNDKKIKEHDEAIAELSEKDEKLDGKIDELNAKLDKLSEMVVEDRIERMRSEILDAATTLSHMDFTEEHYTFIFSRHSKYEEVLKENNMTNGQVDAAYAFIKKRYQEQLQKGF